ncbi:hypothetical protein C5B85_08885 [Pseudoclavibacter sp. AY1F1]|uniref:methyltransferase n=1 Tax=Pseudoclavibacter sp. AY1F1 TaxID=2080583 RepID=UPI000CE86A94|nr:methyltransferase [Pseudoclavibacter sp. AY1F1]PPF44847.1 hypothetical protein C5B85_08885 [Pseudoclavibacter sp. AY1F1]
MGINWDEQAQQFSSDHYRTTRGQTRLLVLLDQVESVLPSFPISIIDVGSGPGHLAIEMAKRGHFVTCIEPSSSMRTIMRETLDNCPKAVTDRIHLLDANLQGASQAVGGQGYDLVMCHAVLMYLPDLASSITALTGLMNKTGRLSVVTRNKAAQVFKYAERSDWNSVLGALRGERSEHPLHRAHAIQELQEELDRNDLDLDIWYGVRTFTESYADDTLGQPDEELLAAEIMAAKMSPYRDISHLIHLMARRR